MVGIAAWAGKQQLWMGWAAAMPAPQEVNMQPSCYDTPCSVMMRLGRALARSFVVGPMMVHRYLLLSVVALLAGCAADQENQSCAGAPLGYHFHDGTHIGGCAPASPQAIYNASHGTWLWPPLEIDTPPD
jgi:hypothetical protein